MLPSAERAVGGTDPLDSQLGRVGPSVDEARRRWRARRRLGLGLSPTPDPILILLLIGMALGPHGLGVLTQSVLASLDPAVSVSLAALGVYVGLDMRVRGPREGRLLAAATVEAGTTILMVVMGVFVIDSLSQSSQMAPWLLAVLLGVCASASSTTVGISLETPQPIAQRIGDLDDVVPIVAGMLVLAWTRSGAPAAGASVIGQSALIALLIALATWLLITQTSSGGEQRVFAIGALLLLGGVAEHLSLSALFIGFLAGMFWTVTGGPGLDAVARDMRHLQHPLMVLLLIVAGARVTFSADLAGLAVAYVVLRTAGKVLGGWLAALTVPREAPRDLGFHLISPGIVGIAFALNVLQAGGGQDAASAVFTTVVLGSLGAELFSLLISRRARPA